jgi:hypothetical protein
VFAFVWAQGRVLGLLREHRFRIVSAWPEKTYKNGSAATLCYCRLGDESENELGRC